MSHPGRSSFDTPVLSETLVLRESQDDGELKGSGRAMSKLTRLVRETRVREPRRQLQRVRVVELLQHRIGQADAVELPERVIVPVIVEILVVGLEHPPVVRILVGLIAVLPEQNPILIL